MLGVLARLAQLNVGRQLLSAGVGIKQQITRQVRHTTQTVALALAGAIFALATFGIGVIALYLWLARDYGPFVALGVVGLLNAVIAVVLFAIAFMRNAPGSRPATVRPALSRAASAARAAETGLDRLTQRATDAGERVVGDTQALFKQGSRQSVIGLLLVAGVVGLIVGRRL